MATDTTEQFTEATLAEALRQGAKINHENGIVIVRHTHAFVNEGGRWTISVPGNLPDHFAIADGTSIDDAVDQICLAKAERILSMN